MIQTGGLKAGWGCVSPGLEPWLFSSVLKGLSEVSPFIVHIIRSSRAAAVQRVVGIADDTEVAGEGLYHKDQLVFQARLIPAPTRPRKKVATQPFPPTTPTDCTVFTVPANLLPRSERELIGRRLALDFDAFALPRGCVGIHPEVLASGSHLGCECCS